MSEPTKVILATLQASDEGTTLTLMNTDKKKAEFVLDDLALSLIGLTVDKALDAATKRISKPFIFATTTPENADV